MRRFFFLSFLILLYSFNVYSADEEVFPDPSRFPLPDGYQPNVDFWTRVYGEWHDNQMVIHDAQNINIVLDVVDLPQENLLRSAVRLQVKHRLEEIKHVLLDLDRDPGTAQNSADHKKFFELYKGIHDPSKFRKAAENLRVQQGIRDRFQMGLEQMTKYVDEIKKVMREEGVPEEIAYLPLVESSFNNQSLSKTKAAGIWQFMRSTARFYMKVNSDVDERLDPYVSSRAAARYLKRSYEMFGNWPVSVMSYNHGQQGILNAVHHTGSSDFMDILNNYDGRLFGFASRNFYGEFLAACRVMHDADKYFGTVNYSKPLLFDSIQLSQSLSSTSLLNNSDLTREELRTYNPALQSSVLYGRRPIPAGYSLHLPQGRFPDLIALVQKARVKDASQKTVVLAKNTAPVAKPAASTKTSTNTYIVRRGDTLFGISKKFATTVDAIRKLNGLNQSHITPGQKLLVTGR